jgi:hypothetical protein
LFGVHLAKAYGAGSVKISLFIKKIKTINDIV